MEARPNRPRTLVLGALLLSLLAAPAAVIAAPPGQPVSMRRAGGYRTQNFVVRAPSAALAREIGEAAELQREQLAIEWIGEPMPAWTEPCPITAQVAPNLGAGGATSFVFDRGQVFGWEMNIQGSRERVLDSVLPHEITHTVFASYFRQPLPRWADEGACTTVEHHSEIAKQEALLVRFLKSGKGIPFTKMFAMKEYPQDILPLYAQGHSLTQFLMESHGKPAFLAFLTDGMQDENWRRAVETHYGHESLYSLQTAWLDWVKSGRPRLDQQQPAAPAAIASATPRTPNPLALASSGPARAARPSVYSQRLEAAPAPPRASVYDASNRGGAVWR